MPSYVTYMEVSLNSEGVNPAELSKILHELGWRPVYGRYDYGYKWDKNWGDNERNINNYFTHMNKVHKVLKGHKVSYSLRTYEAGKENFWVKWSE